MISNIIRRAELPRTKLKIIQISFALAGLLLAMAVIIAAEHAHAETVKGTVTKVLDGDSLIVKTESKQIEVRLFGVDAPEWDQPFGPEAKAFTTGLSINKKVTVKIKSVDKYKRTVGEVFLPDGKNLGHTLVNEGLAWWYQKFAPDYEQIKTLENKARKANKGIWSQKNPIPPWDFRIR